MARRVPPPAGMIDFIESIRSSPVPQAGTPPKARAIPTPAPTPPPAPSPALVVPPSPSHPAPTRRPPVSAWDYVFDEIEDVLRGAAAHVRRNRRRYVLAVVSLLLTAATTALIAYFATEANAQGLCMATTDAPISGVETPPAGRFDDRAADQPEGTDPAPHGTPLHRSPDDGLLLPVALLLGIVVGRRGQARRIHTDRGTSVEQERESEQEPAASSSLAACSVTGMVRTSNQDRVRVAQVGAASVIVMADGMGGLPHGGEAAECASVFAMKELKRKLPIAMEAGIEGVRTLLLAATWATATQMACDARRRGWAESNGFRSTLIVVVALDTHYLAAYLGDGGVFIERADGELVELLDAHKSPDTPNLLDASLGPATEGRPSWVIALRQAGDVLAVATDGIADVYGAVLAAYLRKCLQEADGNARRATKRFVDELAAECDDEGRPALRDNLTLAVAVTPGGAT